MCFGWRRLSTESAGDGEKRRRLTGLLHTLPTSFVRWQMSRLVSDFVPVHLHHWLSAAPDCLPSVTELFRLPLLLVWNSLPDLVTSAPSIAVFRSRLKTHLFNISYPSSLWLYSARAVTRSCFGHCNCSSLLTYLLSSASFSCSWWSYS